MKFLAALMMTCTAASAAAQRVDTTATKREVLAADSALLHAVQQRGPQAFLDALEPDAPILFPAQPIYRGAAEARAQFMTRYDLPSSYTWRAVHVVASTNGRLGCVIAFSHFTNAADTIKPMRRGQYLTCWRRGTGGQWRIAAHQRSDTPPVEPELKDGDPLPGAPHSATVSRGNDQRDQVLAVETQFAAMGALLAGPGPAFAHYVAPDGHLFFLAEHPRGPEQVLAAFQGFAPNTVLYWGP